MVDCAILTLRLLNEIVSYESIRDEQLTVGKVDPPPFLSCVHSGVSNMLLTYVVMSRLPMTPYEIMFICCW